MSNYIRLDRCIERGIYRVEARIRPSARSAHRSQLCKAGLERPPSVSISA